MAKPIYLIGNRFGILSVISEAKSGTKSWICTCDCGTKITLRECDLIHGTMSCGCKGRGDKIQKKLVKMLKNALKIEKLTMQELAAKIGLSQPTIGSYIAGRHAISIKSAEKILEYFEG